MQVNKQLIAITVCLGVIGIFNSVAAEVYKWKDNSGNTHYSDRPPASAAFRQPQKATGSNLKVGQQSSANSSQAAVGQPIKMDIQLRADASPKAIAKRVVWITETISQQLKKEFATQDGVVGCEISQYAIDDNKDGIFDGARKLNRALDANEACKDKAMTGILVLDWEGKWFENLQNPEKRAEAIAQGLAVLSAAKRARPKAMVGFYGLPFREYWHRDANWMSQTSQIASLLSASGALFPSVYDFYKSSADGAGGPGHSKYSEDEAYVRENVQLAVKFAKGKPVYPYVWGRYHDSNERYKMQEIPEFELKSHVAALNVPGVSGVVWWGGDTYFFKPKTAEEFEPLHRREFAAIKAALQ